MPKILKNIANRIRASRFGKTKLAKKIGVRDRRKINPETGKFDRRTGKLRRETAHWVDKKGKDLHNQGKRIKNPNPRTIIPGLDGNKLIMTTRRKETRRKPDRRKKR